MKKYSFLLIGALIMLLAACTEEEAVINNETPQMVEVDIQLPDSIEENTVVPLRAEITQGGEPVEDANEVLFEIWNDAAGTESVRHEAEHVGDGIYELEHTFEEVSVYTIQAHTTARDMHVMPKMQFNVGEPTEEQIEQAAVNAENQESNHMHGEDSEEHSEESHDDSDEGHDH
ncbi:FixH family protein [Jeotgalibacillus sp. R-1-5s-1]|uniref:FixH family protein n=1 Tax=Jeotgalibacillus sp. R-1-5s-1 TaxID=2555897 RepID=UPI00106B179E|nr:FixH family protein [Jeotgalibacillus sp. R-1-5s-1]TFE00759.1 hypothetical protein E2491_04400 [Jeotgalibacillus sp. R-1-5s-1]